VGQAHAWNCTLAFAESLAVKCVVLLGIPEMIAHEGPRATLSLNEIVARLPADSPDVSLLFRIMRFLVAKGIFRTSVVKSTESGACEMKYGLTPVSKWLVKEREQSMATMLLFLNDERTVAPWHRFNVCVLEGGTAFERANGSDIWSYASTHPDFNHLFNDAIACYTATVMKALLSNYHGFDALNSLVDVGGGTGTAVAEIVRAYPPIKGINYDLPHVVAIAPHHPGVEQVGGNMFATVPSADAIFLKGIMHDWGDDDCIKILKNCRKAIPETGRVIIVDMVLNADKEDDKKGAVVDPNIDLVFDLLMAAHTTGGKERTEEEWKKILCESGFGRYNIITIPPMNTVIEVFPQ